MLHVTDVTALIVHVFVKHHFHKNLEFNTYASFLADLYFINMLLFFVPRDSSVAVKCLEIIVIHMPNFACTREPCY